MTRRIVAVLDLAGGGQVLLLECRHEIRHPLGGWDLTVTEANCRTCPTSTPAARAFS